MNLIRLRAVILQYLSIAMVIAVIIISVVMLSGASESHKSMSEVSPAVVAMFENERAAESSDRYLKKYYGLNGADYEAVVFYFPVTNMDAEELLIIKLKDTSQAESVRAAMEARQQTQINIYEGYAPEQLALCENGIIDVQGNYVLYVVHTDAVQIDNVFRESLK